MVRRVVLTIIAVAIVGAVAQAQRGPRWEVLGQRVVTDRADHDTIAVTAAKGTFTAVRFDVTGHAVDFHRVVIHFRNGDDQKVELRNTIRSGSQSRVIDIEGKDRVIRSIDFWYDAKTIGRGGKATVRAMGRN
ncbi:MAG TPA: hypothetical protein VN700_04255 [Vicinamibacterales bacterium]|nr:hypothetical protein [Vicinamibacterales bacterium]